MSESENPLDGGMPIHTACGLPAELCECPDAKVKFDNGKFVDQRPIEPGSVYIDIDQPGSEDAARQLLASGMKVLQIKIRTEEVECPVCGWPKDEAVLFDFIPDEKPIHRTLKCGGCDFPINLSPELIQLMEDISEGRL